MKKRLLALALVVAMALAAMTGCSQELDESAIVAEVGEEKITLGVANFYARYQQSQYETYYASMLGENMWAADATTGYDYEESVKAMVMDSLQMLYVIRQHAEEYSIVLTDEEKADISEAAKDFIDGNELEAKEAISGSQEVVEEMLTLLTYQTKMFDAMVADVDREVSDEEAARKGMQYVAFNLKKTDEEGVAVDLTDEEKAALKKDAEAFAEAAKTAEDFAALAEEKGYEVVEATFDKETVAPAEALIAAADTLTEGQTTDVIEGDTAYYVAQLTTLLDREATDLNKESIIAEREQEQFNALCTEWIEGVETKVHDRVWATVNFEKVGVTIKGSTEE